MVRSVPLALGALILVVMAGLLTVDLGTLSSTVDEPFHVTRGLAWWWSDSTRLSYAHPPLANAWMAIPTAWLETPVDFTTIEGWERADNTMIAKELVADDLERYRTWLFRGRMMSALLALGFVAYVGTWVGRRWGAAVGLVAMALVAFNPSLLAHARLVTTDCAVIAALFIAVTRFVDYLDGRPGEPLGFALAVGAALGIKYTTATMVPWFLGVGALWAWKGWGRFEGEPRSARVKRLGLEVAFTGAVGWLLVLALYRFEGVFWSVDTILSHPEPSVGITESFDDGGFLELTPLGVLPGWLPIPLPYTWLFGLMMIGQQSGAGWRSWLFGYVTTGTPLYFPVMLLVKTPLPVLAGLFLHFRFGRRDVHSGLLLGAAAWLGVFLLNSGLNVGVRHALPVVPLLTVVVARDLVMASPRWGHWLPGAAVGWVLLRAVLAQGDYLSWFNIGDRGYAVSVIGEDWGQDMDEAADVLVEMGARPVHYDAYGAAAVPILEERGLRVRPLKGCKANPRRGVVMLHRNQMVRLPRCMERYDRPPDRVVNEHLFLWRVD